VLLLASFMMRYGVEYAAAGAMIGVMIGELSGLLILFLHYRPTRTVRIPVTAYSNDTFAPSKPRFQLKQLLLISLPVTGSKLVGATSYLLESILIMQSLAAAGIVTAIATAQYGALQGMVFPILLLPSALTYSLSTSLIPSLSEAAARNDMSTIHKRLNQSLRLAMLSGAPFAVIMFVLAEPLCMLMYNQPQVGMMLKMMAPIALLIYVQAPLQATLQALDRPGTALINTLIGAAVKLTLIAFLASKPELGILGAIIAINVNILIVTILHWVSVSRLLRFTFDGSFALKVGFAMLLSGASCYFVMSASWEIGPKTRFLTSFLSALLVFTAFTPILKLIDRHDIQRLFMLVKKAVKL
jgi:stage V sporulation protein B